MHISVVKAMQVIRDEAKCFQRAEVAPLVAAAVEVANAYEEELSRSSVVSIISGPTINADEIAEKVSARLWAEGRLVRGMAQPLGMPPTPWHMADFDLVRDNAGNTVLDVDEIGVSLPQSVRRITARAVVEAVNAYFARGLLPHPPAQAATANSETQLPDTAGYPVDIPAAAEVPDRAGEKLQKAFDCEAISVVHEAYVKALNMASCKEERVALSLEGMRFAIAVLWMEAQLPAGELQPVNEAVQTYAADLVAKAYRGHRAGESPNAA